MIEAKCFDPSLTLLRVKAAAIENPPHRFNPHRYSAGTHVAFDRDLELGVPEMVSIAQAGGNVSSVIAWNSPSKPSLLVQPFLEPNPIRGWLGPVLHDTTRTHCSAGPPFMEHHFIAPLFC